MPRVKQYKLDRPYRVTGSNGYRSYTVGTYRGRREAENAVKAERARLRKDKRTGIRLTIHGPPPARGRR